MCVHFFIQDKTSFTSFKQRSKNKKQDRKWQNKDVTTIWVTSTQTHLSNWMNTLIGWCQGWLVVVCSLYIPRSHSPLVKVDSCKVWSQVSALLCVWRAIEIFSFFFKFFFICCRASCLKSKKSNVNYWFELIVRLTRVFARQSEGTLLRDPETTNSAGLPERSCVELDKFIVL